MAQYTGSKIEFTQACVAWHDEDYSKDCACIIITATLNKDSNNNNGNTFVFVTKRGEYNTSDIFTR